MQFRPISLHENEARVANKNASRSSVRDFPTDASYRLTLHVRRRGAREEVKPRDSIFLNNVAHFLFQVLEIRRVRIVGYSDAAFANNGDLTSQLGL